MFNISELKAVFKKAEFINERPDIKITSVEHDTRRIKPKSLYIAIQGDNLDGHDFVVEAMNKGAVACICERKIDNAALTQIIVKDSVKAYGELARFWRDRMKCPVLGLTGSNGKTTTKDLIYTILSKKFKTARTQGNFNNLIGVPYTILGFPLNAECAIVEMGMNAMGEIAALSKIADPDVALITNIGRAHIGRLGSMDAVISAKTELFDYVLKKGGSFCLNVDDEKVNTWVDSNKPKKSITYCYANSDEKECSAQVCVKAISSTGKSQKFKVYCSKTGEEVAGNIKIIGSHNLNNVVAAIAVGVFFGMDVKSCVKALKDFVPPAMRSNVVKKEGVTYIVDCYNANPDSMIAAIRSMEMAKEASRKIAVVGDMLELDGMENELHKEVGLELAQNKFDLVFAIGKYSPNYIEGFESFKGDKGKLFAYSSDQMQKLRKDLFPSLKRGDYVLIKASRGSKLEAVFDK
jgi:UDP-N-acetylmuramoyl-tripeptide--D-alanyl-D-alanine ligase